MKKTKKKKESLDEYGKNWILKKSKFNWLFFLIGIVSFVPTMILMIMFSVDQSFLQEHSWFNYLMLLGWGTVILWAIFAAQRRKLIGAYGESILLLIPTFVWLLPTHEETIKNLLYFAAALMIFGGSIYFVAIFMRFFVTKKNEITFKNVAPVLMRFGFVFSTVVSTLILSILLINFADYSVKLIPNNNPNNDEYILFISIIAIIVALMIIVLELLTVFKKRVERAREETMLINVNELNKMIDKEVDKKVKDVSKTMKINLKKNIKKKE